MMSLLCMMLWKGLAHGLCAMVHVQGLEGSRDFCKKWSGDSNWSGSGEGSCEDSKHVMSHVVITMIMCLVMWRSCDLI